MPPSDPHRFRAGDVVRHVPSGEGWVLAVVEGDRAMAAGWPLEQVDVGTLELDVAASDEEHVAMLRTVAAMSEADPRREAARRQLAALEGAPVPAPAPLASRVDQALAVVDRGKESEVAQALAEAYREANRRHNDFRSRYVAEMQAIVAALGTPGAEMTVEEIVEEVRRLRQGTEAAPVCGVCGDTEDRATDGPLPEHAYVLPAHNGAYAYPSTPCRLCTACAYLLAEHLADEITAAGNGEADRG